MDTQDVNFDELLDNIRRIKSVIKQNSCIFRQLVYSPIMKMATLIFGLISLFIPFFYYVLLQHYIKYEKIPFEIRLLLIVAVVVGFFLVSSGKIALYIKAWHQAPRSSFLKTFSRVFSRQVLLIYPGLVGSMIFFTFFFIMQQNSHFVFPTIAIGMGFLFVTAGLFVSMTEFFVFGYFNLIMGVISVPFISVRPLTALLWTSGVFGLGMLAFYLYITFFHRMDKEHPDGQ